MKRMPMKKAEEYDALTKTKRFLKWRRGERKRIKQRYNKAERQWLKQLVEAYEDG
jgi:hypothetical protein